MYFPDHKLAVFCDSMRHHRGRKAKAKDAAIDEKLAKIGLSSVRIPGKLIVEELKAAADLVSNTLAGKTP
jgi:very-short-patch-repair endonuclease